MKDFECSRCGYTSDDEMFFLTVIQTGEKVCLRCYKFNLSERLRKQYGEDAESIEREDNER